MIYDKKAMDIAIPLLVLMTLVLVSSTFFVFSLNSKKIETNIENYNFLNEIYAQENKINFYAGDIVEGAVSKIEKGKDIKTQFIDNFNKELQRYKKEDNFYIAELEQLESQVTRENIKIINKKLSIKFKINFEKRFQDKMIVLYSYEKEFEGQLP